MRTLLIMLVAFGFTADAPMFWSAPYTHTGTRVYTAERARLVSIEERGEDGPIVFSGVPTNTVTLEGDVNEGELTIEPLSACWRVVMRSNDPNVYHVWHSAVPCTYVYMPMMQNGS